MEAAQQYKTKQAFTKALFQASGGKVYPVRSRGKWNDASNPQSLVSQLQVLSQTDEELAAALGAMGPGVPAWQLLAIGALEPREVGRPALLQFVRRYTTTGQPEGLTDGQLQAVANNYFRTAKWEVFEQNALDLSAPSATVSPALLGAASRALVRQESRLQEMQGAIQVALKNSSQLEPSCRVNLERGAAAIAAAELTQPALDSQVKRFLRSRAACWPSERPSLWSARPLTSTARGGRGSRSPSRRKCSQPQATSTTCSNMPPRSQSSPPPPLSRTYSAWT